MQMLIAWGVTTLVTAFVGSYLAGYLRRKGENLATHEDIDKLVAQVAAVTTATKEIEAKISNDVWERQRKWEIKREAIFEAMKELASAQQALTSLDSAYRAAFLAGDPDAVRWSNLQSNALDNWTKASLNFDIAKTIALLICGEEVRTALDKVNLSMLEIANSTFATGELLLWKSLPTLIKQVEALAASVRKELHIE